MKISNFKCILLLIINLFVSASQPELFHNFNADFKFKTGEVYHYNKAEIFEQSKEKNWCHKYYNESTQNPFYSFINNVQKKLRRPASQYSRTKFDNLFDNRRGTAIWGSFDELNECLTKTKLSMDVTLQLDWNKIFKDVRKTYLQIQQLDNLLLRFYTITSKLFYESNILRLAQKISIVPEQTIFSKSIYYPKNCDLEFQFNKNFINQHIINDAFFDKRISTNTPIVSVAHEYAQALIFYVYNDEQQREQFNTYPISNLNLNNELIHKYINIKEDTNPIFKDVSGSLFYLLSHSKFVETNNPIEEMLIPLLVVDSSESRRAWNFNNVNLRDHFFTEAFAKWIGTESSKRDYSWQLLNAYFMRVFPIFYDL